MTNNGWISVEDRLPEDGKYLCVVKDKKEIVGRCPLNGALK